MVKYDGLETFQHPKLNEVVDTVNDFIKTFLVQPSSCIGLKRTVTHGKSVSQTLPLLFQKGKAELNKNDVCFINNILNRLIGEICIVSLDVDCTPPLDRGFTVVIHFNSSEYKPTFEHLRAQEEQLHARTTFSVETFVDKQEKMLVDYPTNCSGYIYDNVVNLYLTTIGYWREIVEAVKTGQQDIDVDTVTAVFNLQHAANIFKGLLKTLPKE